MRFVILSNTGCTLGLAYHLNKEGNSVHVTNAISSILTSSIPDITICDTAAYFSDVEDYRSKGGRILGASAWVKILEVDKVYRESIIKALGYKLNSDHAQGDKVTVFCWFNGHQIVSRYLIFPYKKLMVADVGTTIDCSGYLAYFDVDKSQLVNELLNPLTMFLRKANHHGCFSIECTINKDGVYVDDISASIDKAYITALFENARLSKTDILLQTFNESSGTIQHRDPWVSGVMLSISPYPYLVPEKSTQMNNFNPFNLKHLWLIDVVKNGDVWECGHSNGCLGYVTAHGTSIQEVMRRCNKTIEGIKFDGIQYRNDIGKDVYTRFDNLKNLHLV